MSRVLRIAGADRYEVNGNNGVWKSGAVKRAGPLPYVRVLSHGMKWSAGYRAFLRIATIRHAASCFGVFIKLLEVGADADRDDRWIIHSRKSRKSRKSGEGYLSDLANDLGFAEKDVIRAIEVLTHEDVAWVEWVETEDDFPESPESREPVGSVLSCPDLSSKKERSAKEIDPLFGIEFPAHMDTTAVREATAAWLAHHVQIGKPYKNSPTSVALLFKQHPTPEGFVEDVEYSIANNYQGLIAPGGNRGPNKSGNIAVGPGQRHRDENYGKPGTF